MPQIIENFFENILFKYESCSCDCVEDINANLDGIHPVYDSKTMAPAWKVDSLLCAAYFSIFYLKPDLELYRPCDNPRCGRYFLVKTTSTRNRFCSQECCNRVTQDRYRKRRREKEENK